MLMDSSGSAGDMVAHLEDLETAPLLVTPEQQCLRDVPQRSRSSSRERPLGAAPTRAAAHPALTAIVLGALVLLFVACTEVGANGRGPRSEVPLTAPLIGPQVNESARPEPIDAPVPESVPDVGWYPSPVCEGALFRHNPNLGERYDCGAHNATQDLRVELVPDQAAHQWLLPGIGSQAQFQPGAPFQFVVRLADKTGRARDHCADVVRAAIEGAVDGHGREYNVLLPIKTSPLAGGLHRIHIPPLQSGSYSIRVRHVS
jgi:hypothetical protein